MAGLETQWGHYRIVDSHGNVTEGDGWICNNTTTPGHQYVGNEYGDSDYIQEFTGKYGTYYSAHLKPLSGAKAEANAWCIYKGLKAAGWSVEAIAGLCGNIQNESAFSPGRYEGNRKRPWPYVNWGCGLTQWTANIKLFNWCKENGDLHVYAIESQIDCINYESLHNVQYGRADQWPFAGEIPQSFIAYRTSTMSPFQLGKAFWYCYERPKDPSEANGNARGRNAEKWYKFFTGSEPPTPVDPTPDPGHQDGENCTYTGTQMHDFPNYTLRVEAGNYFSKDLEITGKAWYTLPDNGQQAIEILPQCDSYTVVEGTLPTGVEFIIGDGQVMYPSEVWGIEPATPLGNWTLGWEATGGTGPTLQIRGSSAAPGTYHVTVRPYNNNWGYSEYKITLIIARRLPILTLLMLMNKEELPNASNSRLLR